jgi:hypothetical protein
VDNDFLEGVEMKPGEADQKLIEVIRDSPTPARCIVPDSEDAEMTGMQPPREDA